MSTGMGGGPVFIRRGVFCFSAVRWLSILEVSKDDLRNQGSKSGRFF